MQHFLAVNAIYSEHFMEPYPARYAVAVVDLPLAAEIEIEAIAIKR
jgi:2-iminobutanoate/2-iminopropanoate deaminase